MNNAYKARPFREYNPQQHDRSSQAQQTINDLRARYMLCGPSNYHRSHFVVGWVTVGMAIGAVVGVVWFFV